MPVRITDKLSRSAGGQKFVNLEKVAGAYVKSISESSGTMTITFQQADDSESTLTVTHLTEAPSGGTSSYDRTSLYSANPGITESVRSVDLTLANWRTYDALEFTVTVPDQGKTTKTFTVGAIDDLDDVASGTAVIDSGGVIRVAGLYIPGTENSDSNDYVIAPRTGNVIAFGSMSFDFRPRPLAVVGIVY